MPPPWPIPALYPSFYPVPYPSSILPMAHSRHSSIPIPYPFHHPLIPPSFYPSCIHGPFLSLGSIFRAFPSPHLFQSVSHGETDIGLFYPYMKGLDLPEILDTGALHAT